MRPLVLTLFFLSALPVLAQTPDGFPDHFRPYTRAFALVDGRVETVTNGTLERATIVIRDGRIEAIGTDIPVPADAERIDASGLTVYPGLIDAGTRIGIQEVGSLSETVDVDEIGEVTPHVEALTAVNPNSALIPVARVGGVTTALAVPQGGLLPGTAALVDLFGYTPEQMAVGFEGVMLEWPSALKRGPFDQRTPEKVTEQYTESIERLDAAWHDATVWAYADSAHTADDTNAAPGFQPEAQALTPVVRGERLLLVQVDRAQDILNALTWLGRHRRVRAALVGAAEGWRVADRISAAGLPVIAGPVLALPTRPSDRYDRAYTNAALLRRAGVTVSLRTNDAENIRNLPFHAGFAAAYGAEYGFDRQAALEAVTINPARLFGVADRLGSLEVGKEATLFLADGDCFEPATHVRHLFIRGWRLPLTSRQTDLYEEFLQRAPGVGPEGGGE